MRWILLLLLLAEPLIGKNVDITVTNSTGGTTHFDPSDWAVIKRSSMGRKSRTCKPTVKYIDKPYPVASKSQPKRIDKIIFKKNRISVLAGYGPIGLITKKRGDTTKIFEVEKEYGPVTGIRYTRSFSPIWSASLEYITNDTLVGTAGFSW